MVHALSGGVSRLLGALASIKRLLPIGVIVVLAACNPSSPTGGPAGWTGQTTVDPLTDASVTTAVAQVWAEDRRFLSEITLKCTVGGGRAEFDAAALFFDDQSVGAPLLVIGHGGPQDVAILRVGELEAVPLGLGRLSAQYSNQLFLLRGSTESQNAGDLRTYSLLSELPDANRLVLRPTLTTGEPVFTIGLGDDPVLRQVFIDCAQVFERFREVAGEEQARLQVRQEQADLYAPQPSASETPAPAPPRREDFEQRAAQAEADCMQRYGAAGDRSDASASMCTEIGDSWRRDFVNAASEYASSIRARHYGEFGQHRWAAEGRAAALCFPQYEAARRAAATPAAADTAAQAAVDCYVAAGNPPAEP